MRFTNQLNLICDFEEILISLLYISLQNNSD